MITETETEGVIKFQLVRRDGPPLPAALLEDTLSWRAILFRLGLTGQTPERYGGLAYGNISVRLEGGSFAISGTQTGGKARLTPEDFCVIEGFDLPQTRVWSRGAIAPSSEALTHAGVYQANDACRCVIHAHSQELWQYCRFQGLPATPADAAYGTAALARAAGRLARNDAGTIALLGHQDGIVSYGRSTETAAVSLLRLLGRALFQASGA